MHHPGPPRFASVGELVELAPRAPDPERSYSWSLVAAPEGSDVRVGDDAVLVVRPDAPGVYEFELDAPDGRHRQLLRAFPDERRSARLTAPVAETPVVASPEELSVVGPFNEFLVGRNRPEKAGDEYVFETALPPGEHPYYVIAGDDWENTYHDSVTVPGPGRPRVRLDATREGERFHVSAEAQAAPDSDVADEDLSVEWYLDGRDSLERDALDVEGRELRVDATDVDGEARIHAVAVGERHSVADAVVVGEEIRRPNDPPDWAESPTVYEIFVRSFAGETPDTTFREIARRVEYLESLGVDCLWLTPVLASPTRHGYHITDYFETAADLGSREEFESLVERCHEAGIRVVFDLVVNHTSRDHPAYQMHAAGVESYADHYARQPREYDVTGVDWAGEDAPEFYFNWTRIPNLNYESLDVRAWMLDVVDEWAEVVDGFRADVAWGVPHGFWKEVADRMPDGFLMLDETIPHDPQYHESEFTMHYDTTLYDTLVDVGAGRAPAAAVLNALEEVERRGFPDSAVHLRYVENHDEDRYLDQCGEAALRAAAAVTFTLPGAPMIYYGQERGVEGYREEMAWHDGDAGLTDFHRALSALRERLPALREPGVGRVDYAVREGDADRVLAYRRGEFVVVCNFAATPAVVDIPLDGARTRDELSGADVGEGGGVRVADAVVLRTGED